ncbi:MAG: Rpn family recombination-promoting nuclease/putative transposase [Tannerella sp.]|nr:Rpn family recombination-promoting nuclease/putative transposase [Tannerella sp.]
MLIDFLNEIIGEKARITDVEYLPNELSGEWDTDRKAVFDLYCKNSEGEYFIVEMQKASQINIVERSLFYSACSICNQAPKGKWDYKLKAVYLVAILDFVAFKEKETEEEYIEQVYLYRNRAKKKLSDKLNMIFVELPKFTKQLKELETNTDRWLYILKNLEKLTSRPAEVQGRMFEKLFEIAEIRKLTKKDKEAYKTSILEYDSIKTAMMLSREEGREEGRDEERTEVAKECFRNGIPIELISKITKLSIKQIKDLLKN